MKHSQGFSLLEVLVTLLLTTVGILGMVVMQGNAIQFTQDSIQRNAAINLANELGEIIRVNPGDLYTSAPPREPFYGGFKDTSLFLKSKGGDFSPAPQACSATPKSATEMRDCWIDAVERQLPGADELLASDFYICRSSAPDTCDGNGSMLEIQLAWRVKAGTCHDEGDASYDADKTICTYRTRIEP